MKQIYKKRKTTVVFTQQPIQPLATFTSGSQIQLVFQNSRNFLDLSKVQLFFRPVIQFDAENGLTQFQRAQLCMTPIDAQSIFTLQSIQINSNQLTSQPQSNLQVTRSVFQGYWNNFISSKKSKGLDGCGNLFSSLTYGGISGSTLYGLVENAITHPANGLFVQPGYTVASLIPNGTAPASVGANSAQYEANPFPRAIISRLKAYYDDFNLTHSGVANQFGCDYYAQQDSTFADAVTGASTFPASLSLLRFPLLPLAVTPSVAIYKHQQEMFQNVRQRFIQQTATSYLEQSTASTAFSSTSCIDQFGGQTILNAAVLGQTYNGAPNAIPPTTISALGANAQVSTLIGKTARCRMQYGISVQNYSAGSSITRNAGKVWSQADSTCYNQEEYTQMSVSLGDISCELRDIGLLCMESAQVIIQLQVNIPQNCISAYLQSGLLADPYNSYGSVGTGAGGAVTGNPTCYQSFLQACLIGNTTALTVTDTTCRIEYTHFEDDAYPIMKQLMYQPKPYFSLRQQYDVIPGAGIFTQRLSIGASSVIAGILVLFPPANRNKLLTSSAVQRPGTFNKVALPQDSVVNYFGCQPPSDLRSTYLDSYYMNLAQIYAEVDGQRYAAMDLNLSNPALSTYLVTQAGLQTTLGKYVNLDLQMYLANRFFYWIPINVAGASAMRIQDQQIVITANIDDASRVNQSVTFNELAQGINGQFGMLSFALTMQSLVDCSYVKV